MNDFLVAWSIGGSRYVSHDGSATRKTDRLEVIRPDLTQPEALTEAKAIWGERAYALPAVGTVACAVGCPGIARGDGATFRAALMDAACRALATAFWRVGCAAVRERNKAIGQAMMQPPEWAYPAAWRNAVMAAVEWCNSHPSPVRFQTAVLKCILQGYHEKRLTGWTAKNASYELSRSGPMEGMDRAATAAYERGRSGHQTPVQRERHGGPVTYWG